MPDAPTWDDIKRPRRAMNDRANGIYGICLRGKAGWGENMAFLTTMVQLLSARAGSTRTGSRSSTAGMEGRARPTTSTC